MTREDVINLFNLTALGYNGVDPADVLASAKDGKLQLWRLIGPRTNLLVITSYTIWPKSNELVVHGVSGKGFTWNVCTLKNALIKAFDVVGITHISWSTMDPRLGRIINARLGSELYSQKHLLKVEA